MLIVISGLPGTGKSAVAAAVAAELGAVQLSIDLIEQALRGAGLLQSQTGVASYEAVRAAAEQNLAGGWTVVVDAVNDSEPARDTWRVAAGNSGCPLVFILLTLDDLAEHRRRLEGRVRNLPDIPEPTWIEVQQRAATYAPWDASCLRVSVSDPIEVVVQTILGQLPRN